MGFETRAGSPKIETATFQKLKLGSSGRKLAGEKNFRRDDGGQVSSFTISLECGAPVDSGPEWSQPETVDEAMRAIEGRYAHYDVVAYEDVTTRQTMRTFIDSYGFTEFRIEDGKLFQIDSFCHAEQILNQKGSEAVFSDAATQAIKPRVQEVELSFRDGTWHIYRPASPTLLGIAGDPSQPLSTDPDDPNLLNV